jgi:hypothetical protein
MPIMAIYRSADVTPETYAAYDADILNQPLPPGALCHQVAYDGGELCIVDLWESREAFEAFNARQIQPTIHKHHLPVVAPQILDLLVLATHDGIDTYKSLQPTAAMA